MRAPTKTANHSVCRADGTATDTAPVPATTTNTTTAEQVEALQWALTTTMARMDWHPPPAPKRLRGHTGVKPEKDGRHNGGDNKEGQQHLFRSLLFVFFWGGGANVKLTLRLKATELRNKDSKAMRIKPQGQPQATAPHLRCDRSSSEPHERQQGLERNVDVVHGKHFPDREMHCCHHDLNGAASQFRSCHHRSSSTAM